MNQEEFEKSKNELEKEKEKNNELIAINDERSRMLKANSLEFKGETILFFSALAYMGFFLTTIILSNTPVASVISKALPGLSYPITLLGGSLAIGTIARTLLDKKFKTKERLKSFSKAKTQAEKLEEEVHYQIELEKVNNRNRVIDETINVLNSNQAMLNRISSRYDLKDKTAPQTKEEAEQNAEKLSATIKDQYDKLDILTVQKVLHNRFWKVRERFQRRLNTMVVSTVSGIFTMFFTTFPTLIDIIPNSSLLAKLAIPLVPFVVGTIGGSAYMLKRNRDHKKAFNNLNAKLEENALEENLDNEYDSSIEEHKKIKTLIENQIRNISLIEIQLQEIKRFLDTNTAEEEKKKDSEEQEITNSILNNLGNKSVENIINDHTPFPDGVYRPMYDIFTTSEEEKQKKGPTLAKRRKPTNLNDKKH